MMVERGSAIPDPRAGAARTGGFLEEESIKSIGTEERKVIFASSLGTVFEWYDFYLYATLAPFFAALFFPSGNETAALLSAFATYAAGFLVRPFGAIVFGRIGDLVGRKYTFLITILFMGGATFLVGLLPTFQTIGWAAPVLLVTLRLVQGLALGGEYGGAATYVAEHAPHGKRGYDTSWIQTTATLGFFLALLVIGVCRVYMDAKVFADWGWRIPFWVSLILLVFSVYIRLKLHESPIFQKMKAEGKGSKSPLTDSFLKYPNNKYVLLALLGATAGQGVVWYTGQFYALFFLTITLKLDYVSAYTLIGVSLLIGTPFFIFFGWLSDRIGRLKIILAGCLIAAVTYFPLFQGLTHYVNPQLEAFYADHRRGDRLQVPHFRRAMEQVFRLRPGQGLPDQAGTVVQVSAGGTGQSRGRNDRYREGRRLGSEKDRRHAQGRRSTAKRR
jgi:MFS family permease